MRITQDQLDAAVWGTGHGSRRHLVDHERSRLKVPDWRGYHDDVRVRCADYRLSYLDSNHAWRGHVMRREPCVRCQKLTGTDGDRG